MLHHGRKKKKKKSSWHPSTLVSSFGKTESCARGARGGEEGDGDHPDERDGRGDRRACLRYFSSLVLILGSSEAYCCSE